MIKYFTENDYFTPKGKKLYLGDYICFKTRIYFYILLLKRIIIGSWKAKRGEFTREYWAKASYDTFSDLEGCGIKFNISGIHNLKKIKKSAVVIGNHMSNLETFILPAIIAPYIPVTFVIKDILIKLPFFGKIMNAIDPIAVGRKNPREDLSRVLSLSADNLKKGKSVIIFPQSTRKDDFSRNLFNSLGVKVALKAGVPAIPLALKTDALENGRFIKDFGKLNRGKTVYIRIGNPLNIEGNGKSEHGKITEYISSHLAEWGVEVN